MLYSWQVLTLIVAGICKTPKYFLFSVSCSFAAALFCYSFALFMYLFLKDNLQ